MSGGIFIDRFMANVSDFLNPSVFGEVVATE